MSEPLKKLHGDLQKIQLTAAEKSDMRAEIVRFVNEHPASIENAVRHNERTQPFGWFVSFLTPRPMPALLALLIVVFTGGGVSLASQNALPGDLLYPVKVAVTEEVRAKLTFSDEAKLKWEIDRSERRLVEAALLEAKGELKAEAAVNLAARVEDHNESIVELESVLEARGEADVVMTLRSEYQAKLLAYESLLYQVLAQSRPIAAVAAPFAMELKADTEAGIDVKVNDDAKAEASAAAQIHVKPRSTFEVRLPDLIKEVREESKETREDVRDEAAEAEEEEDGERRPPPFRDEAAEAMNKAKNILNRITNYIEGLVALEGQDPFVKTQLKLDEAANFYHKGTAEFNAGRFAAAFAHFSNSINFSSQAEIMANSAMSDLSRIEREQETSSELGVDLAITDISIRDDMLTVVQANLGDASYNALNGHTYIWIDDMRLPKWTYSWATLANSNRLFLNAYGNSLLQPQSLAGKHTVKACIDALNVVKESDESNNCMVNVLVSAEEQEGRIDVKVESETKVENSGGIVSPSSDVKVGSDDDIVEIGTSGRGSIRLP